MRAALLLITITFSFYCCTKKTEDTTVDSSGFHELLSQYYQDKLRLFPLDATSSGIPGYNDYLPNFISESFRDSLRHTYSRYLSELEKIDPKTLTDVDKVSFEVLSWECTINIDELNYPTHLTPFDQFYCLPNTIGQYASGSSAQPFNTVKDYHDWLKRLDDYMVWCDTAMANMRKGMEQGYVLPKALTLKVIPQVEIHATGPVEGHLFFSPAKNFPDDFTEEEKRDLKALYHDAVANKVMPKYAELTAFFKDEYLQTSRESSGISAVDGGREYYDHQIKTYTTLPLSADEIFEIGMSEVERIQQEMEKVKEQVGFEGDIRAFVEHVRTNKDLMPYTDPKDVIEHFNEIHEKMKPNLEKLFETTPKAGFEVRRTEAFREKSASAEYNEPSLDGSRPGIFYVPIPEVKEYNIYSDESLFLHEAIPGHHYQIALQQENASLPDFRKSLFYSAYGEGWALYCESLGKELGLYDDPYQYFGMLGAEMHRAIRLVVDAGMHTKGWTREQAIQFSLEHEAESEDNIIREIERYMSWPGQALSYKIGQLKIRELRTKAETELGENFNIREFHNMVLETGCIPLAVLEGRINSWIEAKKM